ncbi:MAG: hypothetical protein K6F25_02590 [Bacteroidales bacterium]|nr:hypothetical protein [Bacteroidales bacterium]
MIKRIAILIIPLALALSCYQDLSTTADQVIPDIEISGVPDTLETFFGEEIALKAVATLGGEAYDGFVYEWAIDLRPRNSKDRISLSETPEMSYRVANQPNESPYCLSFTATDSRSGLSKSVFCHVYVHSSLGEGILVAHTRDGGKTSDFDLLANKFVTYGYTGDVPRYTRNIYALANGQPLDGKVNAVMPVVRSDGDVYNETLILVGTDEHLIALDPLSFTVAKQDGALFNGYKESTFEVHNLINYGQIMTAAQINGQLWLNICHTNNIFNKAGYSGIPSDVYTPTNIGYSYAVQQSDVAFFHEQEGKFYYMHAQFSGYASFSQVTDPIGADLSGGKSLWAGAGREGRCAFLIQDASGIRHIVYLHPSEKEMIRYQLEPGQWLQDARYFAFCDNADILFMASENKVASVTILGGSPVYREINWAPENKAETITGIKFYTQGWYGSHGFDYNTYTFPIATNRMQIVIFTYNESTGEGKIYLRPFNVSTGLFTFKDNGVYGGFGRITAAASTFR